MISALLLTTLLSAPAVSLRADGDQRLSPDQLVEEAWRHLDPYDGNTPALLSAEGKQDTSAAAHLLEAALALSPDHARALWSLGHAEALLGEDAHNRGAADSAERHFTRGNAALSHALELDSTDPWSRYARGVLHSLAGAEELALADLDLAITHAERRSRAGDDSGSWVRFKALERRAEALMRTGQYGAARDQLRSFHGEFSSNEWPLMIALAESFERERDFGGAREAYEVTLEKFPNDYQAYALLGYLEGLVGERERAAERMLEALERELAPGMYTRLWLWILATGEARAEAREDLTMFLRNPPDAVSPWDRELGSFVLGTGDQEAFLTAAENERQRRLTEAQPLDDLLCEAWFYAGLRAERDAGETSDPDEKNTLLQSALDAHRNATHYRPEKWKWEWAYARLHFSELADALGLGTQDDLVLEEGADSLRIGDRTLSLQDAHWHSPRAERSALRLGRSPLPGDLLMVKTSALDARTRWEQFVVDVR